MRKTLITITIFLLELLTMVVVGYAIASGIKMFHLHPLMVSTVLALLLWTLHRLNWRRLKESAFKTWLKMVYAAGWLMVPNLVFMLVTRSW